MVRLRHLLGGTTGLTFVLLLLGIYTAATGSGLACGQRWPVCDGAVLGLFPATWPSFIEWIHRLVALVTGLVVVGTTWIAWRRGAARRIKYALGLAVVLLPAQILLGAETVFTYSRASRALHFATAITIFISLVAAMAWAYGRPRTVTRILVTALLSLPLALAFGPRGLLSFSPAGQAVSYAAGLTGLAALIGSAVWLDGGGRIETARRGAVTAAALTAITLLLRRLTYTEPLPLVDLGITAVVVTLVLAVLALVGQAETGHHPAG